MLGLQSLHISVINIKKKHFWDNLVHVHLNNKKQECWRFKNNF